MKKILCCLAVVLSILSAAPRAFAWGNAVHTWLADNMGAKAGTSNFQEMYGAILTDQYNFIFDQTGQFMAFETHNNVMTVVVSATTCPERAAAFGLAMHNNVWGADSTAHVLGRTTPVGYVIFKGTQLAPELAPELSVLLMQAGLPPDQAGYLAAALAPQMGHILVEYAIDLKIKQHYDRSIGAKMASAALVRSRDIPDLMAEAYTDILVTGSGMTAEAARAYLIGAENDFRRYMIIYGKAFCGSDRQALAYMAWEGAVTGSGFIKAIAGVDIVIPPALVSRFIVRAGVLVEEAPDYATELADTLSYLRQEMAAQGIGTCAPGDHKLK
jgi:hypothetical protein